MPAEFSTMSADNLQLLDNVEQLDPLLILGLLQRGLKILLLKQWKNLQSTMECVNQITFGSGYFT